MALEDLQNYYSDLLILQYKTKPKARSVIGALVSETGCNSGEWGKVGYIVVGSPTIVDGIASGFTQSDYLICDTNLETEDIETFEVCVKFTTGSEYKHSFEGIYGTAKGTFGFYLTREGVLHGVYLDNQGTHDNIIAPDIQLNTTYYAKMVLTDEGAILSISQDGKVWDDVYYTSDDQHIVDTDYYFMASTSPFSGSLDLNATYIRINGRAWSGYALTEVSLPSMIINGFDIDTAEGKNLDIIGQYVGLNRVVRALIGDTNTNILNDEQYRLLLKLKLIKNTNFSSTSQLRAALYTLFPTSIRLFDNRDMTYEYQLSAFWSELLNVLVAEELLPVPMALGYTASIVPNLLELYGYSDYGGLNDNPNGYSSYDTGFRGRYMSYGDKFTGEE